MSDELEAIKALTPGVETSEYLVNKLASVVAFLSTVATWVAMFADVLSEQGAVIITAAAAILAAVNNGSYIVSRGKAKSGS